MNNGNPPTAEQAKWIGRQVRMPTGRFGVVEGWSYDRLTIRYTDTEGGTVAMHPNLVDTADGPRPTE